MGRLYNILRKGFFLNASFVLTLETGTGVDDLLYSRCNELSMHGLLEYNILHQQTL